MRQLKRAALALGAVVVAAGALTACGGDSGSAGGSKADDGTVTLDWEMWAGSEDEKAQLDHLAQMVTDANPKLAINLRTAPFNDYFTKLQTEFATGEQACIVSMQSLRLAGYTDLLEPLGAHVPADGFDPAATAALNLGGEQLAMPFDLASMLVYYNKDAFEAAGLDEPKAGWTIADFENAAESLTKDGKSGFGMSFSDLHTLSLLLSYNGAEPVTDDVKLQFDDQRMIDAVTWYAGLAKDDVGSVPASAADGGWGETQFVNGNAMMAVDGSWNIGSNISSATFDVGVAPLPAGVGGSKTYIANSGFGVSKDCAYKDEAYEAIRILTGAEAAQYLTDQGRSFPARTEQQPAFKEFLVAQDPDNAEAVSAAVDSITASLGTGVPLFTTKNWDEVSKNMARYLIEVYTGASTPADALAAIQQQGARNQ